MKKLEDMTDEEMFAELRGHGQVIASGPRDTWAWCVRVARMRDILQELTGKPVDHGDFVDSVKEMP